MRTTLLTVCLGILLAACGSESDMPRPGPSSGVDQSKTFGQLTAADLSSLCDWTAGCFGGYGHTMTCQGSSLTMGAAQSHDQCVASWNAGTLASECLSMTVEGYQDCVYNLQCPLLWMAENCSAVRDCMFAMMEGG